MIPNRIGVSLWLLIFGLTLAWRLQNLEAFGLSNDEGVYLMWARLVVDGYPLYSETYAVQPPLFLEALGLAFRLAGQSIQAGRGVILAGYILLAVSLSWLAYRAEGWGGALTALVLVGISPLIFTYSRLAMAEIPATALAVAALAALFLYREQGQSVWLILSGLILGLSFITKPLNPFLVIPAALVLFLYHGQRHWRAFIANLLVWGTATALPVVAIFIIYDPLATYDQLVAFRGDLRAAIPGAWSETQAQFNLFISSHWGFWLLAFGGIISAVLRAWQDRPSGGEFTTLPRVNSGRAESFPYSKITFYNLIWMVWLGAGVAMLGWHTPLFFHHFAVLLPPLILLGAALPPNLIALWQARGYDFSRHAGVIGLLLVLIGALLSVPTSVDANQEAAAVTTGGREQDALQLLKTISHPEDFLMGDSQLLIFMAGRRTPPSLGDVALVAIKAGRQTSGRMIELTQAYQAPAVVQWSLRLPWLPDYLAWVQANYLAQRVWDNDHIIYFVPRLPASQPLPQARHIHLGEVMALRGYELQPGPIRAGDDLSLKVYWQADTVLAENYTVFTQLLDSQGALVAGHDSQPLGGYFPTSQWPAGEIVTDMVRLPLPAELPAGRYTLITGMYLLETLERLPVPGSPDNSVGLGTIDIQK